MNERGRREVRLTCCTNKCYEYQSPPFRPFDKARNPRSNARLYVHNRKKFPASLTMKTWNEGLYVQIHLHGSYDNQRSLEQTCEIGL
jgi:hypothetical protein